VAPDADDLNPVVPEFSNHRTNLCGPDIQTYDDFTRHGFFL
jgi:hypothetical protein